jgi:predicted transcriptional regulator YdeE
METYQLDRDIKVFRLKASSFPDGVLEAHQTLHSKVPYSDKRNYFGISRPENGVITYWSAAEETEKGELEKFGFEPFTIPKGTYVSIVIKDFMKDISSVGRAFQELIHQPGIDPEGYCIEWYMGQKDVRCMVRMK